MAELTVDQQKAVALARARVRAKQKEAAPADDDALSMARTATGGLIEGIPVVGPIIRGGVDRAAAATIAAMSDETYDEALKRIQEGTVAEKEANPGIDTAAQVTGAVGGTIPMIVAAPAAFGGGTGSMLARTAASAATGTGLGTVDAAIRSDGDPEATAWGAGTGFGMGIVGPALGKVVGSGLGRLSQKLAELRAARGASTSGYAIGKMANAVRRDALDPATMKTRLAELGPEGVIGDLGPNLQGQVAALANMPGEGNQAVRSALNARHLGANGRLASTVDETLGSRVVPSHVDESIRSGQRAIGSLYDESFANARAVDTTPVAEFLDSSAVNLRGKAQEAVRNVRSMLNVNGTELLDPHPGTLFQTRQAIDGMLRSETDGNVIRALSEARKQIDDVLTASVPDIKAVDAKYAELAKQREAVERGQTVLESGRTSPRPEELAKEVADGALPDGTFIGPSGVPARLRQGARAEVDRILGNNANDIATLNRLIKSEGDWNRARLSTLFGDEKAGQLFKVLDNELTFAKTRDYAVGNSFTAGRTEAIRELGGGAGEGGFGFRDAVAAGGLRGAAVKGGEAVAKALASGNRDQANAALADLLMSNRESVVDALSKIPNAFPRLERGSDAVVRALLMGGVPAGTR